VVAIQHVQPVPLPARQEPRACGAGQLGEQLGVTPPNAVDLATGDQGAVGELPDDHEHLEPRFAVDGGRLEEAVVDEGANTVQDVDSKLVAASRHRLDVVQSAAPHENRASLEESLRRRFEKVIAPSDRVDDRLLSLRYVGSRVGEQTVVQSVEHCLRSEESHP
jgi:hypothetical protein